jgi:HPt (histidine-containing phosphotransfer) domain-containing protein
MESGLALMQGNEARYRQWLGVFIAQAPVALTQMRKSLAAGDPEPASMAAHTLRGSTGLLGMKELHTRAAALETAIDAAEAAETTEALLHDLASHVDMMCAEIKSKLGLDVAVAAPEILPERPGGETPVCVTQLIERLDAGDGDCDAAIDDCLSELKDTAWVPRLRQAHVRIRNFDYAAAIQLLAAEQG